MGGLVFAAAGSAADVAPLLRPGLPLLLVDDAVLASQRGLVRTLHPARTRSEPVVRADQPWEGDRVYTYGSVHRDESTGAFWLWYMSRTQRTDGSKPAPQLRNGGQDLVLRAVSADGLQWRKPALGLHAYDGSAANNIVFDLHSPAVVLDRFEPDPARRFKLLGRGKEGYVAAASADGRHWRELPGNPVFQGGDTMSMTQHPRTGEFLVYHKLPDPAGPGRVVWLRRSRDLRTWTEPVLVMKTDAEDNRWAQHAGQRTDVYNLAVLPHAGGFVGFPTIFRVMADTPRTEGRGTGQSGQDGPIDVQLATSSDGETWRRSWPRTTMIPRGAPGRFDGGAIFGVTNGTVEAGDETWLFYTALNTGHGAPIPPKRASIGRAAWRRHGFASLDAGPAGGVLETVPLRLETPRLVLNVDAAHGELRVALLEADGRPIAGRSAEECEPVRRDAVREAVRWRQAGEVPTDRPVRVRIELRNARLYSLAAGPEKPVRATPGTK